MPTLKTVINAPGHQGCHSFKDKVSFGHQGPADARRVHALCLCGNLVGVWCSFFCSDRWFRIQDGAEWPLRYSFKLIPSPSELPWNFLNCIELKSHYQPFSNSISRCHCKRMQNATILDPNQPLLNKYPHSLPAQILSLDNSLYNFVLLVYTSVASYSVMSDSLQPRRL